jgi:hypothetical protein
MGNVLRGKRVVVAGYRCLTLGLLAFATASWAASTPIYKCLDKNLSLVYTDVPCKDGEQLDIRSGDADSGAVARLERQQDALDQSADQRAAEERRALVADSALPPRYGSGGDEEAGYDDEPAYTSGYYTPSYWLTQYLPMHPRKPKAHHTRRVAPRPPYIVPRP